MLLFFTDDDGDYWEVMDGTEGDVAGKWSLVSSLEFPFCTQLPVRPILRWFIYVGF